MAQVTCTKSPHPILMRKCRTIQLAANGLTTTKLVRSAVEKQHHSTVVLCAHGHGRIRRGHLPVQEPSCSDSAQEQSKVWSKHHFYNNGNATRHRCCKQTRELYTSAEGQDEENAHRARMADNGEITHAQSVDSRHPSRPHDETFINRHESSNVFRTCEDPSSFQTWGLPATT